jgi:hypothetical protein
VQSVPRLKRIARGKVAGATCAVGVKWASAEDASQVDEHVGGKRRPTSALEIEGEAQMVEQAGTAG